MNLQSVELSVERLLQMGLEAQQAGHLAKAQTLYLRILERTPGHVDALHFMGLIECANPLTAERGIAHIRQALHINPRYLSAHFNLGNVLRQHGRVAEAIAAYRQAQALAPEDADVLVNLGESLRVAGELDSAEEVLARALCHAPASALAAYNLALVRLARGELRAAEETFSALVQRNPRNAAAWSGLGLVHQARAEHAQAVLRLRQALALEPAHAVFHCSLGQSLAALGQTEEGFAHHLLAIQYDPNQIEPYLQIGQALIAQDKTAEAGDYLQRAMACRPQHVAALNRIALLFYESRDYARALACLDQAEEIGPAAELTDVNRAAVLRSLGRIDEAIGAARRAAERDPASAEKLANLGVLYKANHQLDAAVDAFTRALALDPSDSAARFNLGLTALWQGHLGQGWDAYELRDAGRQSRSRADALGLDRWIGSSQDLSGRTIVLSGEQGYGDTIQFVRYASLVATLGGQVVLEVQSALADLVSQLGHPTIRYGEPLPRADFHCPLPSLPGAFATELHSIPGASGYLKADPHRVRLWADRLGGPASALRVAVCWSGQRNVANNRSIPLAQFRGALFDAPVEFIGVQTEIYPEDRAALAGARNLHYVGDQVGDFSDTAAILAGVDLVITIDSALAHLAGALGRPTWLLLPYSPDWRWLIGREDSPWYQSMRLYRQPALGDWASVLDRVRKALAERLGTTGDRPRMDQGA